MWILLLDLHLHLLHTPVSVVHGLEVERVCDKAHFVHVLAAGGDIQMSRLPRYGSRGKVWYRLCQRNIPEAGLQLHLWWSNSRVTALFLGFTQLGCRQIWATSEKDPAAALL